MVTTLDFRAGRPGLKPGRTFTQGLKTYNWGESAAFTLISVNNKPLASFRIRTLKPRTLVPRIPCQLDNSLLGISAYPRVRNILN